MTKMTDHNENTTHMTATHNTLVVLCSSDSCVIGGVLLAIFIHTNFIVYTRLLSDDDDDDDDEDDKDDNKYDANVNTFGLMRLLAQRELRLR